MKKLSLLLLLFYCIFVQLHSQKHTNVNFTSQIIDPNPANVGIPLKNSSGFSITKNRLSENINDYKISSTLFSKTTVNGITTKSSYPRYTSINNGQILDDYFYSLTPLTSSSHHALGVEYDDITNSFISIGSIDESSNSRGFYITKENTSNSIVWSKEISLNYTNPTSAINGKYIPTSISILKNIYSNSNLYNALPVNQKVAYAVTGYIEISISESVGFVCIISPNGSLLAQKILYSPSFNYLRPKKIIEIDEMGLYITGTLIFKEEYIICGQSILVQNNYTLSTLLDYDLNTQWINNLSTLIAPSIVDCNNPMKLPIYNEGGTSCCYDKNSGKIMLTIFQRKTPTDLANFLTTLDVNNGKLLFSASYGYPNPALPGTFDLEPFMASQLKINPNNSDEVILSGFQGSYINNAIGISKIRFNIQHNNFPNLGCTISSINTGNYFNNDIDENFAACSNNTSELFSAFFPEISYLDQVSDVSVSGYFSNSPNNDYNLKLINFNDKYCPITLRNIITKQCFIDKWIPSEDFFTTAYVSDITWTKNSLMPFNSTAIECGLTNDIQLNVTITQPNSTNCANAGKIVAVASQGVPAYTYTLTKQGSAYSNISWTNSTGVFDNLSSGNYSVSVIDLNLRTITKPNLIINSVNFAVPLSTPIQGDLVQNSIVPSAPLYEGSLHTPILETQIDFGTNVNKRTITFNRSSIEPNENQPFYNTFNENLTHSVWYKFFVPPIKSRIRLYTSKGTTLLTPKTAIAVYKRPSLYSPININTFDATSLIGKSFGSATFIGSPIGYSQADRLNHLPKSRTVDNNVLIPNPCSSAAESYDPNYQAYIEFDAEVDDDNGSEYYVQIFFISPIYNNNPFAEPNILNLGGGICNNSNIFLTTDIEPYSEIIDVTQPNMSQRVTMNRFGINKNLGTTGNLTNYRINYTSNSSIAGFCNTGSPINNSFQSILFTNPTKVFTDIYLSNLALVSYYSGTYLFGPCYLSSYTSPSINLSTKYHEFYNFIQGYKTNPESSDIKPKLIIDYSISPNPTNDNFMLQNCGGEIDKIIQILDISGRVVYTNTLPKEEEIKFINGSYLSTGSYLVKISDREGTLLKVLKLEKQ